MHRSLARVWCAWSEQARLRAAERLQLRQQLALWVNRAVAASWRAWQSMLAERAATLSVVGGRCLSLAADGWRRACARGQRPRRQSRLLRSAALRWLNLKLATVWKSWMEFLQLRASDGAVATRSLVQWTAVACGGPAHVGHDGYRAGWSCGTPASHHGSLGEACALEWVALVAVLLEARAETLAVGTLAIWSQGLLAAGWRSWLSTVTAQQHTALVRRSRHWSQRLLAAGWRSWLSTVATQQQKQAIARRSVQWML